MGTLEIFSRSYCENASSCVLVDAWLQLALCLCVAVALLLASRCCWLCPRRVTDPHNFPRDGSMAFNPAIHRPHSLGFRLRRLLRRCRTSRLPRRTSPLPLAIIKKDATAAHIQGHKNSRQQGDAFMLQTQRMTHMDMAAVPPPALLEDEETQEPPPKIPPLVFPRDSHKQSLAGPQNGHGDLLRSARTSHDTPEPPSVSPVRKPRSNSAVGPRKASRTLPTFSQSLRLTRSSRSTRKILDSLKASGQNAPDSELTNEHTGSFRQLKERFTLFKRRTQASQVSAPSETLFNEPTYESRQELAALSPEDRAENERRASMQLRDKRRVSVGANSRVQFEVNGGDQASVYEVKLREIQLVKRLASGPLSDVYAAIWRDTKVGVKLLMPREGVVDRLEEAVQNFRREIWVMNALTHANIVKLLGASLTPSCYVLVMEYMPNGSLYDFLRDAANFVPQQLVVTSAFDIAKGMAHIHASGVLQRDLKSKNCLLSENLVTKVADFGLARFRSRLYSAYTWVGTPFWAAPEVIRHEPYDEKADVYSYAVVLWELVERKDPYEDLNAFQVPLRVANDGLRPHDFTKPAPLGLEQLMRQCWDSDPEQRPSFDDIARTLQTWLYAGDSEEQPVGSAASAHVDLSELVQSEQTGALETELHRFAESHDASEKAIPITLSSLRRGLSTSRLKRQRTTGHTSTAEEIEQVRKSSMQSLGGAERLQTLGYDERNSSLARVLLPAPERAATIDRDA